MPASAVRSGTRRCSITPRPRAARGRARVGHFVLTSHLFSFFPFHSFSFWAIIAPVCVVVESDVLARLSVGLASPTAVLSVFFFPQLCQSVLRSGLFTVPFLCHSTCP